MIQKKHKYSYEDLIDASTKDLYDAYANKSITLVQFRQRVYEGKMSMHQALTQSASGPALKPSAASIYIGKVYKKLSKTTIRPVTQHRFVVKMSEGFAPSEAIKRISQQKKSIDNITACLKGLKAQEHSKNAKPLNSKEQEYIKNNTIINNAFRKITSA